MGWIILIILVVIIFVICYNGLVSKKNSVENALSTIDTCLQTRLDLMSSLFEQIDVTLDHESKVYNDITALRSQHAELKDEYDNRTNKDIIVLDKKITNVNRQVMAVRENYPELSSIRAIVKVIDANVEVENQINAARRNYNNNVNIYRNALQSFPSGIFASIGGFKDSYELYKADEAAKNRVSVKDFVKDE